MLNKMLLNKAVGVAIANNKDLSCYLFKDIVWGRKNKKSNEDFSTVPPYLLTQIIYIFMRETADSIDTETIKLCLTILKNNYDGLLAWNFILDEDYQDLEKNNTYPTSTYTTDVNTIVDCICRISELRSYTASLFGHKLHKTDFLKFENLLVNLIAERYKKYFYFEFKPNDEVLVSAHLAQIPDMQDLIYLYENTNFIEEKFSKIRINTYLCDVIQSQARYRQHHLNTNNSVQEFRQLFENPPKLEHFTEEELQSIEKSMIYENSATLIALKALVKNKRLLYMLVNTYGGSYERLKNELPALSVNGFLNQNELELLTDPKVEPKSIDTIINKLKEFYITNSEDKAE